MSKISLKPALSGTATFTIEAPATNTDRIFELPDEAGKVLTTGNNDPAEVFKQANILGTVSESGGVPTGAIIQRGSNANGEFVRYADGTMICTMFINTGNITQIGRNISISYPSSFSQLPFVMGGDLGSSGSINVNRERNQLQASPRDAATYDFYTGSSDSSVVNNRSMTVVAIGRWY